MIYATYGATDANSSRLLKITLQISSKYFYGLQSPVAKTRYILCLAVENLPW